MYNKIALLFLSTLLLSCTVDPLSNYEKKLLANKKNKSSSKIFYTSYDASADNPYHEYESDTIPEKKYIYYPRYDASADNPTYPQFNETKPKPPAYKYPRYDANADNPTYATPEWKKKRPVQQQQYHYPTYDAEADNPTAPPNSLFDTPMFDN